MTLFDTLVADGTKFVAKIYASNTMKVGAIMVLLPILNQLGIGPSCSDQLLTTLFGAAVMGIRAAQFPNELTATLPAPTAPSVAPAAS